jgi:hypothetical protein
MKLTVGFSKIFELRMVLSKKIRHFSKVKKTLSSMMPAGELNISTDL